MRLHCFGSAAFFVCLNHSPFEDSDKRLFKPTKTPLGIYRKNERPFWMKRTLVLSKTGARFSFRAGSSVFSVLKGATIEVHQRCFEQERKEGREPMR